MTPVEKYNVALGLLGTARPTRLAAMRKGNLKLTKAEIEPALAKDLSHA